MPGFIVTLLLAGFIAKTLVSRNLTEQFDRTLDKQASAIVAITEQDEDGVELEVYREAMPKYFDNTHSDYFEVHDTTGQRLFSSESLAGQTLEFKMPISAGTGFEDVILPRGVSGRLVRRSYFPKIDIDDDSEGSGHTEAFHPPGVEINRGDTVITPTQVIVTVASSKYPLTESLNEFNLILLVTGLLTTATLLLLQNRAIKHAVKPINALANDLSARTPQNIYNPIKIDTQISELDLLAGKFDELLQSVSSGMEREKTFSANMAHEIRTPIAEMQSLLEVHERWPEDRTVSGELSFSLLASLHRMRLLVDNILAIGRGESGQLTSSGHYDVADHLHRMITTYRDEISSRNLRILFDVNESVEMECGAAQWPSILDNLLGNAIAHAPTGSTVKVKFDRLPENAHFFLEISNPAPELQQADIPLMFNRLWRKDSSRTSSLHSGLGLSLVKTYCDTLGFKLEASIVEPHDLLVSVKGSLVRTVG